MPVSDLITEILDDIGGDDTIGEAVQEASFVRSVPGTLNIATDRREGGYDETITGRAVFETDGFKADIFPEGTGGSGEYRVYLFEMEQSPKEGDTIAIADNEFRVSSTPRKMMNLGTTMLAATVVEL